MADELIENFINKVERMRRMQKEYFQNREYEDLKVAIRLESEVDRLLQEIRIAQNRNGWE